MLRLLRATPRRFYKVLAIETSCDDTCVAILDRKSATQTDIVCHYKSTLDSSQQGGIVPTQAHIHHQEAIADLAKKALAHGARPDLVCVTQGPGMPGSLSVGLDFAKGLSIGLGVPMLGVNHMLGHLLMARMFSDIQFPFVSLLASGGHTMLVLSTSLYKHDIICETMDIACGDALDKCARELGFKGNMLAKEMEAFIKESDEVEHVEMKLPVPLRNKTGRVNVEAFSFSSFITGVRQSMSQESYTEPQRRSMASQVQNSIFHHIIDRSKLVLKKHNVSDFVVSGGVGSNLTLRSQLQHAFPEMTFHFPPLQYCTDNAVMIGYAGIELHESGAKTNMDVTPVRKWPLTDLANAERQ